MKYNFENKVALVTGAASGIGFTAKAFADAGAGFMIGQAIVPDGGYAVR